MLHTKYSLHMYTYIHCISRRWAVRPGVPLGRGCPGRHRIGAAAHAATYTQRSILYAYIDGGMYACMYVCGFCRALNGRCLRISLVFLLYLHLCVYVCIYSLLTGWASGGECGRSEVPIRFWRRFFPSPIHTYMLQGRPPIPQYYVRMLADVTNTYIVPDCQVFWMSMCMPTFRLKC